MPRTSFLFTTKESIAAPFLVRTWTSITEGPQFAYRTGDILMPEVKFAEPVRVEAEHFVDCIRNSQKPLTGLAHARTVVSILERARPLNGEVKRENLAA